MRLEWERIDDVRYRSSAAHWIIKSGPRCWRLSGGNVINPQTFTTLAAAKKFADESRYPA